jgi:glycogen debranching enzyme
MHWRPHVYARFVQRCRRADWSAHALCSATDEHVEDVLVNVAHALSLRSLGRMSGDPSWEAEAARVEEALVERCWNPRRGLFFDLAGRSERQVEVSTWSSLAPLVLEGIPLEIRERLAAEHLLHPRRYGARFGVPSVSMEEPSFRPGFCAYRTWRGAAWMNTAWMMVGGLRMLGASDEAAGLTRGVEAAVERSGFREYYHPRTGAGHAERGFGFATLVVDLDAAFSSPSAGVAPGV